MSNNLIALDIYISYHVFLERYEIRPYTQSQKICTISKKITFSTNSISTNLLTGHKCSKITQKYKICETPDLWNFVT